MLLQALMLLGLWGALLLLLLLLLPLLLCGLAAMLLPFLLCAVLRGGHCCCMWIRLHLRCLLAWTLLLLLLLCLRRLMACIRHWRKRQVLWRLWWPRRSQVLLRQCPHALLLQLLPCVLRVCWHRRCRTQRHALLLQEVQVVLLQEVQVLLLQQPLMPCVLLVCWQWQCGMQRHALLLQEVLLLLLPWQS
jgi:hypothetical protein